MEIDDSNVVREIHWRAVAKKNEKLLREWTILAMKWFLEDKVAAEELESIGTSLITVGIEEEWKEELKLKDRKLDYVLSELSIIEKESDEKAKEKIKRFILYLEGKDYEKIE